jgi:hypothetical protein
MVHRVPAGLDAAHVGFIFIDVVGNGHCGAPSRGMISQPGLSMPILFPIPNLVAGSSRGHHGCASSTGALPQGERKTFTCIDIGKRFALARQLDRLLLLLSFLKNLIRVIGLQENPAVVCTATRIFLP